MLHRHILIAALSLAAASHAHATTYTFEPNYTQGIARWVHLGFANPTLQFGQGEGTLVFDRAEPGMASVSVTIPLDKFTTSVPELDEHLRSKDFFDTGKFPTATFKSTRVEKSAMADHYKVSGLLEMHGISKPVVLEAKFNSQGINPRNNLPSIGFDATTTVKRSDFGMGHFVPQVSDEIRIEITAEAAESISYAELLKKEAAEEAAEKAANDAAKKN